MSEPLRIIVFGAHPDDCDFSAGGTAALWAEAGHQVHFVSVTNGDAGHQSQAGAALAQRRRQETLAAGRVLGVRYSVLDNHDGELLPTLEQRRQLIGLIRADRPQLVLGPRPYDYHPDHRYTAILLQDAAYMVTVPNVVALAEHLPINPVFMYTSDRFQRPYPFTPTVVVDIEATLERKVRALDCHISQVYEWLPFNAGTLAEVPASPAERLSWLSERQRQRVAAEADRFRHLLVARYGSPRGSACRAAESFELCEYGSALSAAQAASLFPF
jgi:LmbE family N-acetylglucosaminyl deacetylase